MALEGSLQDMSLADLFEVVRAGNKTGWLTLVRGAERGVVAVSQGRVADAVLLGGPESQLLAADDEALIQMFGWVDASFCLEHDASLISRPIRVAAQAEQLLEASRRRYALRPTHELGLASQLALNKLPPDAERSLELSLDEWRLLATIVRGLALGKGCLEAGLAPGRAVELAHALLRRNLVTLDTSATESPPMPVRPSPPAPSPQAAPAAPKNAAVPNRALLSAIMRRVRAL